MCQSCVYADVYIRVLCHHTWMWHCIHSLHNSCLCWKDLFSGSLADVWYSIKHVNKEYLLSGHGIIHKAQVWGDLVEDTKLLCVRWALYLKQIEPPRNHQDQGFGFLVWVLLFSLTPLHSTVGKATYIFQYQEKKMRNVLRLGCALPLCRWVLIPVCLCSTNVDVKMWGKAYD